MGTVVSVFLKVNKPPANGEQQNAEHQNAQPNRPNFAFIEFQDEESVLFAVEMLDEIELYGKKITVIPRDRTNQVAINNSIFLWSSY